MDTRSHVPDDLIAGRWWEPGDRRRARHGVLDLRDGAELRLTGVFRGNDEPYCTYAVVVGESASGELHTPKCGQRWSLQFDPRKTHLA